jgi:hypothetical protein
MSHDIHVSANNASVQQATRDIRHTKRCTQNIAQHDDDDDARVQNRQNTNYCAQITEHELLCANYGTQNTAHKTTTAQGYNRRNTYYCAQIIEHKIKAATRAHEIPHTKRRRCKGTAVRTRIIAHKLGVTEYCTRNTAHKIKSTKRAH